MEKTQINKLSTNINIWKIILIVLPQKYWFTLRSLNTGFLALINDAMVQYIKNIEFLEKEIREISEKNSVNEYNSQQISEILPIKAHTWPVSFHWQEATIKDQCRFNVRETLKYMCKIHNFTKIKEHGEIFQKYFQTRLIYFYNPYLSHTTKEYKKNYLTRFMINNIDLFNETLFSYLKALKFNGMDVSKLNFLGCNNINVLKFLFENGVDINKEFACGNTFLMYEIDTSGDIDLNMIKFLVDNKANVDSKNEGYVSPLSIALKYHHNNLELIEIMRSFNCYEKFHYENGNYYTYPEYVMTIQPINFDLIKMILNRYSNVSQIENYTRKSLLVRFMMCADAIFFKERIEIIKMLLEKNADPNLRWCFDVPLSCVKNMEETTLLTNYGAKKIEYI
jgi:hypothetical protein